MQYVHKVKANESLREICQKYGVLKQDLLLSNNVREGDISEGLLLLVSVPDGIRYVVKPFDTIKKIADKFGLNENDILRFNNIKEIFLGQIIYLPTEQ